MISLVLRFQIPDLKNRLFMQGVCVFGLKMLHDKSTDPNEVG